MRGCGTLTDVRVLRLPFIAHISCLPHFCQLLPFSPSSPSRSTPSPLHLFTSFSKFPIFAFANENEIFNKNDSRCFHCGDCCCCCCCDILYKEGYLPDYLPISIYIQVHYIHVYITCSIYNAVCCALRIREAAKSTDENCRLPIAPKPVAA